LIKPNTGLTCGCCGNEFYTWEGYVNQDQDKDFGICKSCQGWISDLEEQEIERSFMQIRDALSDKNKTKADKMNINQKRNIVLRALDDGILTYKIGKQQ
jgi:hypothetical protein